MDDGLRSASTDAKAISLLSRTQMSMAESNLRLHKFASNSQTVLETFPSEDCAAVAKDVDLSGEAAPTQRSLGLLWKMAEVTAIVNARPLIPVSNDPDDPFILSPSMLLTQKTPTSTRRLYR